MRHLFSNKSAITRFQVIATIIIIVIGGVGTLLYYYSQTAVENPASFSMELISRPAIPMGAEPNIISITGQRVVFLVAITDTGQGSGFGEAVSISATVPNVEAVVNNPSIKSGEVAEVVVIPNQLTKNTNLTLTIQGVRNGFEQIKTITIEVIDGEDGIGELAAEMREKFIPWIATNYPKLNITNQINWSGTIVNPRILVVMHYLFFSDIWELYLTWHVTILPHDWARIYLRQRFVDTSPSFGFEIPSVQGQEEPIAIEIPDWV